MDKYYHFTSFNNLESINMNGLIPQTGFRCKSIDDERCGVFLTKGMDKTIAMYALMLWRYDHRNKVFNYDKLKSYESVISGLNKTIIHGGGNEFVYEKFNYVMEQYNIGIQLLNYTDFNQYLDGEGVFLSVYGIENKVSENSEECWCKEIIPSYNINIVGIVHKLTGQFICSRELVLAYFMNNVPISEVMKNVPLEYQESVEKLYKSREEKNSADVNNNDYYLSEIPINSFYYPYYTEKTLTYR